MKKVFSLLKYVLLILLVVGIFYFLGGLVLNVMTTLFKK